MINDNRVQQSIPSVYRKPSIERVWTDGHLYREAYVIGTTEGTAILDQFLSQYPSETFVADNPLNWIGYSTGGVREPYTNTTFSVYMWDKIPANLVEEYGCKEYETHLTTPMSWYGLKYDTMTNEKKLKVPYLLEQSKWGVEYTPRPSTIPMNNYEFYGKIYNQDKSVDPNIDCYIACDVDRMRAFCMSEDIQFPVPDAHLEHVNLWGIVYNSNTLDISTVKAYEIVPYS